jgi:hypothetical protein
VFGACEGEGGPTTPAEEVAPTEGTDGVDPAPAPEEEAAVTEEPGTEEVETPAAED